MPKYRLAGFWLRCLVMLKNKKCEKNSEVWVIVSLNSDFFVCVFMLLLFLYIFQEKNDRGWVGGVWSIHFFWFFFYLTRPLTDWPFYWLAGWLIGWLTGRLIGWLLAGVVFCLSTTILSFQNDFSPQRLVDNRPVFTCLPRPLRWLSWDEALTHFCERDCVLIDGHIDVCWIQSLSHRSHT